MESEIKGLATGREAFPVSVRLRRRRIGAWIVSDQELESLRSASHVNSASFGLFGVAFGAAVSLIITLKTVVFSSTFLFAAFWASFWVTVFASAFFLVLAVITWIRAGRLVSRIKEESVSREAELLDRI